jgi:hypothetical protein
MRSANAIQAKSCVVGNEIDDPQDQPGDGKPEVREDTGCWRLLPAPSTLRTPPRVAQRISMKNPNPAVIIQVIRAAIDMWRPSFGEADFYRILKSTLDPASSIVKTSVR